MNGGSGETGGQLQGDLGVAARGLLSGSGGRNGGRLAGDPAGPQPSGGDG
jgi:hypothetical protein